MRTLNARLKTLRCTIAYYLFITTFLIAMRLVASADFLLAQSYPVLLLVTAVLWLPFVHIAWQRCLKDDLLLL